MSCGMDHLMKCAHHTVKEVTHECPARPHLQSKGDQIWEAAGHDVPCMPRIQFLFWSNGTIYSKQNGMTHSSVNNPT